MTRQKFSILVLIALTIAVCYRVSTSAQQAGTNVNVLPSYPIGNTSPPFMPLQPFTVTDSAELQADASQGDIYLQRQVEPVVAASTYNPDHLLAAFGDFRTVDIGTDTGVPGNAAEGWIGYSRSYDRGKHWYGAMVAGFPGGTSPADLNSPLYGLTAGSDAVLATTPGGHFYLGGLFFTRGGFSNVAVVHLRDLPNLDGGDSIQAGKISIVDKGSYSDTGNFEDKPSIAADVPRKTTDPSACGPVYMAYTIFTGGVGATFTSKVGVSRSKQGKCGEAWDNAQYVNKNYKQNQGTAMAVDPSTGKIVLIWRHFYVAGGDGFPDSILMVTSTDFGSSFSAPVAITGADFAPYDQPSISTANCSADLSSCPVTFRSNAFPAIAIDGGGNIYVAIQEKVFANDGQYYEPRVMIRTLKSGSKKWTAKSAIDPGPSTGGQQVMPSLTFGAGLLRAMWYDFRPDARGSNNLPLGSNGWYIAGVDRRMETRVAQSSLSSDANGNPSFTASAPVSIYMLDSHTGAVPNVPGSALQAVNRPNLPMYVTGTTGFTGDYITLMASSPFVATPGQANPFRWATDPGDTPAKSSLAVWTDSRDVVFPGTGLTDKLGWQTYAPPGGGGASCVNPGARDQNVYFSEVKPGVIAGSPATSRQLVSDFGPFERAFPFYVQNPNPVEKFFRLTFLADSQTTPVAGSFVQGPFVPESGATNAPTAQLDVAILPYSTVSKTLYAFCPTCTSTNAFAPFSINVQEITGLPGGSLVNNGLTTLLRFNNDSTAPFVTNPQLGTHEIHTVTVSNPQFTDPQFTDPQFTDPQFTDPQFTDPQFTDPQFTDPQFTDSQPIGDFVWTASNVGNNASAYSTGVTLSQAFVSSHPNYKYKLIITRAYNKPGFNGCSSQPIPTDQLISVIPLNPQFTDPQFTDPQFTDPQFTDPQFTDPQFTDAAFTAVPPADSSTSGTMSALTTTTASATGSSGNAPIQPDVVFIVLRVYGPNGTTLTPDDQAEVLANVSTVVTPQAGDTVANSDGTTTFTPPEPSSTKGFTTTTLTGSTSSSQYGEPVTFTANVVQKGTTTPVTGGTVEFREVNTYGDVARMLSAGTPVGPDGNATLIVSDFPVEGSPHLVNAIFSGTADLNGSFSTTVTETIAKAVVTATAGSGSAVYDGTTKSPANCTVTGTYVGDLSCTNDPSSVGPAVGTTVITPSNISGTGLQNFTITSVNGSYVISPAPTTTTVVSSLNPSYDGDSVTFTATVGPGMPQGQVVFAEGATTLAGPTPIAGGSASFTTSSLAVGSHTITATFSGPNFDGSSGSVVQEVDTAPVCPTDLPNPILTFTGTTTDGSVTYYNLAVTNWQGYPDSMFAAAPDLPPCGLNTSASRTWVDIKDQNNNTIYGFCSVSSAAALTKLWFGEQTGTVPPNPVHITLEDRRCNTVYTSNPVWVAATTFESPALGADQQQIVNPYSDGSITFSAEFGGWGDEIVGVVKNTAMATSACVPAESNNQLLATGRSSLNSVGNSGFAIRATLPAAGVAGPVAVSVDVQARSDATARLTLFDANGGILAQSTANPPAVGACPGDTDGDRGSVTLTATTSSGTVAYAIVDTVQGGYVFVIDNFTIQK